MGKVADRRIRATPVSPRTLALFWRQLRHVERIVSERAGDLPDREVRAATTVLGAICLSFLSRSNRMLGRDRQRRSRRPLDHLETASQEVIEAIGLSYTSPDHYRDRMIDFVASMIERRATLGQELPRGIAEGIVHALGRCYFDAPDSRDESGVMVARVTDAIAPMVNSRLGHGSRRRCDPENIVNAAMRAVGFDSVDEIAGRARSKKASDPKP